MKTAYQLVALILISCSCSQKDPIRIPTNCDELKSQGVIDSFPYPLRPGMPEWKNLTTGAAMYEAVNVPEDILQEMCTRGLVYTCVYCPLFFNFTAFNSVHDGFYTLRHSINSFAELSNRDEAGRELFDYYKVLFDTTKSNIKWIKSIMQIRMTEVFFAEQEYLSKMSKDELEDVLKEAYIRLKFKEKYHKDDLYYIRSSQYLICNILYHNLQYAPLIDLLDRNNMSSFLNNLYLVNGQPVDSIKIFAEQYIKEYMK